MRSSIKGTDMATKNYGAGHRQMDKAGRIKLKQANEQKEISFGTQKRYGQAWNQFCAWAREQEDGAKLMERVTREMVIEYGRELAQKVDEGELKTSTAQNAVSTVNRVLQISGNRNWKSVSPTKECGIPQRSGSRNTVPDAVDRQVYEERLQVVREVAGERAAAVCELARNLGLRSKEASLLDARAALKSAEKNGVVKISDGSKGGRPRELKIPEASPQMQALKVAAEAQGTARALIPADQNWKQWVQGDLRAAREAMGGLHELRSAYACERYEQLTGSNPPCSGVKISDRNLDLEARQTISNELGHNRIDVVNSYIGGRR
jgi:hypothetical protein